MVSVSNLSSWVINFSSWLSLNPATSLHLSLLIQITTCLNRTTEELLTRASWLTSASSAPCSSQANLFLCPCFPLLLQTCHRREVTGHSTAVYCYLGHGQGTPTPAILDGESLWELSKFSFDANICIYGLTSVQDMTKTAGAYFWDWSHIGWMRLS